MDDLENLLGSGIPFVAVVLAVGGGMLPCAIVCVGGGGAATDLNGKLVGFGDGFEGGAIDVAVAAFRAIYALDLVW